MSSCHAYPASQLYGIASQLYGIADRRCHTHGARAFGNTAAQTGGAPARAQLYLTFGFLANFLANCNPC